MRKAITSFFIAFTLFSGFLAGPVQAGLSPNDPYYKNQWYLPKIYADSAWTKVSASPDIVVAVIDSGVDVDHPDLEDSLWTNEQETPGNGRDDDGNGFIDDVHGWDFVNGEADPSPKFKGEWTETGINHGTIIAGIISASANNYRGIAGVSWQTKIMPLKAINDRGDGRVSDVVRAIDYAVNNGADIINLSFVSLSYSDSMQEAIRRAHAAGLMIVAAAGNEQSGGQGYDIDSQPIYPACYDGRLVGENMVIGVAATDALDQKADFSSHGSRCVDIAAPGISFFSTVVAGSDKEAPSKAYDGYWSGTSMAAPLVSGALALIAQANPELSRREIVNVLFASADSISRLNPEYLGELGNGRLNLNKAVSLAKDELYSRLSRLILAPISGTASLRLASASGETAAELVSAAKYRAGRSLASGDVNGDGLQEIVIGAAKGEEARIWVIDQSGKNIKEFLAVAGTFRGGLNVAASDINGDGRDEILAVPASGGEALVRVFDYSGRQLSSFYVAARSLRGGFSLAVGDLDGKGGRQIVVGFGSGLEPQVRIFRPDGKLLGSFFAYEKKFRGGVNVAVANLDGRRDRSRAEIITAPGPGRVGEIKVFDHHAALKAQFLGYGRNWQGGVKIAAGDANNDGRGEIVLGAYPGAAPHVRVFDGQGDLLESFYAGEEGFKGGVNVGIIKVNN